MSLSEHWIETGEVHPIDMAEAIAEAMDCEFERIDGEQLALAVEGDWRTYSVTLAWSPADETLRLALTFEMEELPEGRSGVVNALLNSVNDRVWTGAFTHWEEQGLMVWRYGLALDGAEGATPQQIDRMIRAAATAADRFYPAIQLAAYGETDARSALQVAIAEGYGRA
ncbi:MAG: YbjN domain-containing protein [Hasllibacter sp.]